MKVAAVGLGCVAAAGALGWMVCGGGGGGGGGNGRASSEFPTLSSVQNATLSRDRVVSVALHRLHDYASGDEDAYKCVLTNVADLLAISTASTSDVRYVERAVQKVKRCMKALRHATEVRTAYNATVLEEFDDVSCVVLNACDDKLFNLHQEYTP